MPIYEFENEEKGETLEEFFWADEVPQTVEKDGVVYRRVFGTKSIHIPIEFTQDRPFKYDQAPSGKKKIW